MQLHFFRISQYVFVILIAITAGEKASFAQQAILFVSGQTSACDNFTLNSGPLNCTPNNVLLTSTTPPSLLPTVQASSPSAVASAGTEGMVQFGSISARVQASSSQLPGNPYAATTFNGFWHDAITITSSTLPSGTPVSLLLTASITYSTVCSLSPGLPVNSSGVPVGAGLGAGATAYVNVGATQVITLNPPQPTTGGAPCESITFQSPNDLVFPNGGIFAASSGYVVATAVGASLLVQGGLTANALSIDGGAVASDPPTATFFIDSLTPGASYTTASGFTYFTPSSAFSSFSANLEFEGTPPHSFETRGSFVLGSGSNGINPLNEAVTLQIGNYSVTIPAGSFSNSSGVFVYEGTIVGVKLKVAIAPAGSSSFTFSAEGGGVTFVGIVNPVTVKLAIGDNAGQTTVRAEFE